MLTERTTTLFVSIFYFQKCQTRDYTTVCVRRSAFRRICRRLQKYGIMNMLLPKEKERDSCDYFTRCEIREFL